MSGRVGQRPAPRPRVAPLSPTDLETAAERVRYVGSPKHKFGATATLGVGRPGVQPYTVEQARQREPKPPFTMICPAKWNRRSPDREATALLRSALRMGHTSPFSPGELPKFVYARDPEDRSVVYRAHLIAADDGTYKGYPLTDAEVDDLEFELP